MNEGFQAAFETLTDGFKDEVEETTETTETTETVDNDEVMSDEEWNALPLWQKVGGVILAIPMLAVPVLPFVWGFVGDSITETVIEAAYDAVSPENRQAPSL